MTTVNENQRTAIARIPHLERHPFWYAADAPSGNRMFHRRVLRQNEVRAVLRPELKRHKRESTDSQRSQLEC